MKKQLLSLLACAPFLLVGCSSGPEKAGAMTFYNKVTENVVEGKCSYGMAYERNPKLPCSIETFEFTMQEDPDSEGMNGLKITYDGDTYYLIPNDYMNMSLSRTATGEDFMPVMYFNNPAIDPSETGYSVSLDTPLEYAARYGVEAEFEYLLPYDDSILDSSLLVFDMEEVK